jgi:hypothetical protein
MIANVPHDLFVGTGTGVAVVASSALANSRQLTK